MSDALCTFLNELMVMSGGKKKHISIICDNAKITDMPVTGRKKRRAPGRSVSTPLDNMASRWEPSSSFVFDSVNPSAGTSPFRSNNRRKCRWESMSEKQTSADSLLGPLARPRRKTSDTRTMPEDANPLVRDCGKMRSLKGGTFKTSRKVQDDISTMSSASLPKSLRTLPY
jgi:hypothetical protein